MLPVDHVTVRLLEEPIPPRLPAKPYAMVAYFEVVEAGEDMAALMKDIRRNGWVLRIHPGEWMIRDGSVVTLRYMQELSAPANQFEVVSAE